MDRRINGDGEGALGCVYPLRVRSNGKDILFLTAGIKRVPNFPAALALGIGHDTCRNNEDRFIVFITQLNAARLGSVRRELSGFQKETVNILIGSFLDDDIFFQGSFVDDIFQIRSVEDAVIGYGGAEVFGQDSFFKAALLDGRSQLFYLTGDRRDADGSFVRFGSSLAVERNLRCERNAIISVRECSESGCSRRNSEGDVGKAGSILIYACVNGQRFKGSIEILTLCTLVFL